MSNDKESPPLYEAGSSKNNVLLSFYEIRDKIFFLSPDHKVRVYRTSKVVPAVDLMIGDKLESIKGVITIKTIEKPDLKLTPPPLPSCE